MDRPADEDCIAPQRAQRIANSSAVAREGEVTDSAAINRPDYVTDGAAAMKKLREENEAFNKRFAAEKRTVAIARELLEARSSGLAAFDDLVLRQVRETASAQAGVADLPMGPNIAVILGIMIAEAKIRAASSSPPVAPDFSIISLYRGGDGDTSPHRTKRAIDISRYAGNLIDVWHPDAAALAVTQFYQDLAGHSAKIGFGYALGLPRNLRTDDGGIEAELSGGYAASHLKIYLRALNRSQSLDSVMGNKDIYAEIRAKYQFADIFFDHANAAGTSPFASVETCIQNLIWTGLAAKWGQIRQNGGGALRSLFPDAPDHLHCQTD